MNDVRSRTVSNTAEPVFPTSSWLCTSTPVQSTKRTKLAEAPSGAVKITVNHPSKTVTKILDNTYETLGKSLFYGPPSRIATAVMNCLPLREEIIRKVLDVVAKEVSDLCSTSNPSILRKCSKEDLVKFDLQKLCEEWSQRAPVFYSFLLTSSSKNSANVNWRPSVAVSGSILLKERNSHMNATATMLGILLKSRSIEVSFSYLSHHREVYTGMFLITYT